MATRFFHRLEKKVIISERIFAENELPTAELLERLTKLLDTEIILIPSLSEQSDMIGHADGMVRFIDENTVVANAPLSRYGFKSKVQKALRRAGLTVIDFPWFYAKGSALDARGCYINYLETER